MKGWYLICLLCLSQWVYAESTTSFQQLMDITTQQQQLESSARKQRLADFVGARDEIQTTVNKLRDQVRKAQAENNHLQTKLDDERVELQRLDEQIANRSGDLAAVFSVARQRATEMVSLLRDSFTSAEAPERLAEVKRLSSNSKDLIDSNDLRALVRIMQQEIVATGQKVRHRLPVVDANGNSKVSEVVRLGVFNSVSEGRFLTYDGDIGALAELRRQPNTDLQLLAADYQINSNESVMMVIDPTRGDLLNLTTQRPELKERIHQGGRVGYLILALGVFGGLLALWRWVTLGFIGRRVKRQLKKLDEPSQDNPLGRVLGGYTHKSEDIDSVAMQLEEIILGETPRLTRGEALLKLLAGIAPLLGLLGTVTGMIVTFQSISLFGAGDPRLMADGISQALVTTALGLLVAIPLLLSHLLISSRSRRLVMVLEEQSAGLIARSQGWRA